MELTEDQILENNGKQCKHCKRSTLPPFEYGVTCIPCGYNVKKRKKNIVKIQGKKMNFINRRKYAKHKILWNCIGGRKTYQSNDFDEIYWTLSEINNKNLKNENVLIKNYKDMKKFLISKKTNILKQVKKHINLVMILFG